MERLGTTHSPRAHPAPQQERSPPAVRSRSKMMKRRSRISSPLPALALLLLLLLVCFFHCTAAARLLHAAPPPLAHQENNGVKAGAAEGLVLQEGAAVNGDDELSVVVSEMMGVEEEEPACEEGNVDECLQRRLLRDAHLDYIYTQHKGKP